MTLKEKLEQAVANEAKAYKTLLNENTTQNLEAYKKASELISVIEEQIVKESQNNSDSGLIENESDKKTEIELKSLQEKKATDEFVEGFRSALLEGRAYAALIPTTIATKIDTARNKVAKLRNYCTVHKTKGFYTIAIDDDDIEVYYTAQSASTNSSQTVTPTTKTLGSYDLNAIIKVHEDDLADVTQDLEAWIVSKFSKAYAKKEDHEILLGAGSVSDNMTGIITELGSTGVTEVEQSDFNWTSVSDFIDGLGDYSDSAILVMKHETVATIKKFQTATGNYLFSQNEKLKTINDIPIVECKELDKVGSTGNVIVAGDFSYYHIADRQSMAIKILRERYADENKVGFKGTERQDGNLSIKDAFKILKVIADVPEEPEA
jgi:HK97 family phage major capsid protein